MEEDFIQTQHQNPPLTAMIEEGQQGPGLAARLGHPAPYRGPTRSSPVRQKNGQQRDNLAQAQTARFLRRDSVSSIAYSEELISDTISATLQSTDRHYGIVDQEPDHFRRDS